VFLQDLLLLLFYGHGYRGSVRLISLRLHLWEKKPEQSRSLQILVVLAVDVETDVEADADAAADDGRFQNVHTDCQEESWDSKSTAEQHKYVRKQRSG
jgi:hypothetical protein